jgi:RNA polymerase primary sigma factor
VLDSLVESLKNVPRLSAADELTFAKSVRQYTLINRERVRAEGQLGRRPTVEEVMERMGYASTAELRRAAREGKAARMCLVEANMRLVINVAGRYKGMGLDMGELVHAGTVGLICGIDKFEWERGYRLSTYATWWIRQSLTRAIANNSRTVRLPTYVYEQLRRIRRVRNELVRREGGAEPSIEDIAKEVDMAPAKVQEVLRHSRDPISLDEPLDNTMSGGAVSTVSVMVVEATEGGDNDVVGEGTNLSRAMDQEGRAAEWKDAVDEALSLLNQRERNVITMKYGLGGGGEQSLQNVADTYGVTRERVRQIENKALEKLSNPMSKHRIKDVLNWKRQGQAGHTAAEPGLKE